MKAIVYQKYGAPDVLELSEVEKPSPKADEVLIKIYAVSANAADGHLLTGDPFFLRFTSGLLKPKNQILGADVAGRIEAVGSSVKEFQVGDEVFGDLSSCGWGGFAEYVCAPEDALVIRPANLSFEEAAAVPMAAVTALQGLRDKGEIAPGKKVLINGASGGVGTFAVQIAKSHGAEVTAVCSTGKMDMVRSIGADHAIDYTQEDFTQNGQRYDLIIAANGYHSLSDYKRALAPGGRYVCTGGTMKQIFEGMILGPLKSRSESITMGSLAAEPNKEDLAYVKELLEAGKIVPVIDKCYPLNETPAAMRYLEEGHARGKIVITVVQPSA